MTPSVYFLIPVCFATLSWLLSLQKIPLHKGIILFSKINFSFCVNRQQIHRESVPGHKQVVSDTGSSMFICCHSLAELLSRVRSFILFDWQ